MTLYRMTYIAILSYFCCLALTSASVFEWMRYDNYDEIIDRMDAVNAQNCESKTAKQLTLPKSSVSNIVLANRLQTSSYQRNYYRNRTSLLQMHQTALANAYKFSYIFQLVNDTWDFPEQPSLFYYYLGLTADVTGNLYLVNGSAIFFDKDRFYPNFLLNVSVNGTIPLFGPRAWRLDDYNDPQNWIREPTNDTFRVTDYGAGPFRNYTIEAYKINEWYKMWLNQNPLDVNDRLLDEVSLRIKKAIAPGVWAEETGFKFFGPPLPQLQKVNNKEMPVQYTAPYFDCGRSNKWIVSAVAPIYDRIPRYAYDPLTKNSSGTFENLRANLRVGVAVTDTDFLQIDWNPCGRYGGDDGENYLADTDRCHRDTTICKPLPGFGFRFRGGYMCECRPGYRYPEYIQGPYLGLAVERATEEEYKVGFQCRLIQDRFIVPQLNAEDTDNAGIDRLPGTISQRKKREANERDAYEGMTRYASAKKRFLRRVLPRNWSSEREVRQIRARERKVADYKDVPKEVWDWFHSIGSDLGLGDKGREIIARYRTKDPPTPVRRRRDAYNQLNFDRAMNIFVHINSINKENCLSKTPEDWTLPGDTKFGVDVKLERFGRIGVRMADFLSSFQQNVNGKQDYGTLRGDKFLVEEQVISEVVGVILADPDVEGFGIYFDTAQFTLRQGGYKELFAPYAYKLSPDDTSRSNLFMVDRAGDPIRYTDQVWYQEIKRRWSYNTQGLKKYVLNPWIRSDDAGSTLRRHEEYPLVWRSASYGDGLWSDPYFDCTGYLKKWVVSYRIPFFGNKGYGSAVEFRGVVVVDVKLELLDIEQCPSDFFQSNAFMGSARCDYETTACMPIENKGFQLHRGYRCNCKQGYEYPWNANEYFYTGDMIQMELQRKNIGRANRYDRLTCRMSSAERPFGKLLALLVIVMVFALV